MTDNELNFIMSTAMSYDMDSEEVKRIYKMYYHTDFELFYETLEDYVRARASRG